MLTHGNQIGIEDHRWQDNLGRDNVQVVVFSFLNRRTLQGNQKNREIRSTLESEASKTRMGN